MSTALVFVAALGTALATGLGAVPLLLARARGRAWLGIADGLAAGMMTAATIALLYEGGRKDVGLTITGTALGVAFMAASGRLLASRPHLTFGSLKGSDALAAVSIVGAMTIHSFTEGAGIGVSFGEGSALGLLIALAIAVHNIPEGLAVSLVLVPRGTSVVRAAGWSVFTSLPQPLVAVPAFLFVEEFGSLLPLGLGFAGGAMIWIALRQLMPDALRLAPARSVSLAAVAAALAMLALQAFLLGM